MHRMFAIALLLYISTTFGQSSNICKEDEDLTILPNSGYYFLINHCDIVISRNPIQSIPFIKNIQCTYRTGNNLFFQWDNESFAIINDEDYVIAVIPAVQLLRGRDNNTVILSNHPSYHFEPLLTAYKPKACHRVSVKDELFCYDLVNKTLHQIKYTYVKSYWDAQRRLLELPSQGVYEPVLGAYIAKNGTKRVLVKHRKEIFYDINVDELEQNRTVQLKTHLLRYLKIAPSNFTILYADAGGIVTKGCYNTSLPEKCFFRYHILGSTKNLLSTCLLYESKKMQLGVVSHIIENLTTVCPTNASSDAVAYIGDDIDLGDFGNVPIQLFSLITFIYLCFFFFFAFSPHPNSNLSELSAIMEDEFSHLSILTTNAVNSIKAERMKTVDSSIVLMKRPEQSTQESLEEVCCPGATCNSWLCPHNRHINEFNKDYNSDDIIVNNNKNDASSSSKFYQMSQCGKSATYSKSMDPISNAQLKGIRQLNTTTTMSATLITKPSSAHKTGSSDYQATQKPSRSVIKIPNPGYLASK